MGLYIHRAKGNHGHIMNSYNVVKGDKGDLGDRLNTASSSNCFKLLHRQLDKDDQAQVTPLNFAILTDVLGLS